MTVDKGCSVWIVFTALLDDKLVLFLRNIVEGQVGVFGRRDHEDGVERTERDVGVGLLVDVLERGDHFGA